jgi:hypothetical protein
MGIRTYPTSRPAEAGPDHRIRLYGARHHDFADSFSSTPDMVTKGGYHTSNNPREAEVQAFKPTLSGGGRSQDVVLVLRIASPYGEASLMVTKDEAKDIALALLQGINDAGAVEVAAYIEAHPPEAYLGDEDDDTDGVSPAYLTSQS